MVKDIDRMISAAEKKIRTSRDSTFLRAVMAGIMIGLGATFMLQVKSDTTLSPAVSQVLSGLCFCVGLFGVFVTGADLFTGDSLMAGMCYEKARRRDVWVDTLRHWVLVYVGNLFGSILIASVVNASGVEFPSLMTIANAKCSMTFVEAMMRGVLCNILVCLAVYASYGVITQTDRFFCVLLPVTCFVACGFEHSVANMFILPLAMVVGGIPVDGMLLNLIAVTLGNVIGGAVVFTGTLFLGRDRL